MDYSISIDLSSDGLDEVQIMGLLRLAMQLLRSEDDVTINGATLNVWRDDDGDGVNIRVLSPVTHQPGDDDD